MSGWLINCKEYALLASKSMEKPMSLRERLLFKIHQRICPSCHHVKAHLQLIRDACRTAPHNKSGDDEQKIELPKEKCEEIKAAIKDLTK